MYTVSHSTVISSRELAALRLLAVDARAKIDKELEDDLYTKGLLQISWDRCLSPAGRDAIDPSAAFGPRRAHG
ncbi:MULTISPECIES: hypothetical protein [unclassified Lysobacter]